MSKRYVRRLSEKITRVLNDVSLKTKFLIMFAICVVLPITLSCIIFSIYLNKYFSDREMESIQYTAGRINDAVNTQLEETVNVTNVVAVDEIINHIARTEYASEREYYRYSAEHGLKDYYQLYYTQQEYIDAINIYLFNDTIMNGGIIWVLDENIKKESWYKRCSESEKTIILCVDDDADGGISIDESDKISVVRKITDGIGSENVLGYVKADINMESLCRRMGYVSEYPKFYLVSEDDAIVYDPESSSFAELPDDLKKQTERNGKNMLEIGIGDKSYLSGWKVLCVSDKSDMVIRQIRHTLIVIGINLIIGLIMMICIVFVYKSYNERLSGLTDSMINAEKGDFNEVNIVPGKDEIGIVVETYNHMVNSINNLINDVYKLEIKNQHMEIENTKAELKYLQSQIDPHFIFNILNAMRIVSIEKGYTLLVEQLSGFAKMIRRLLDWSEDYEPLTTEMEFIKIYLQLEKFRFEDKFDYEMDIDESIKDCRMPKMCIQPIVENACRHGLQGKIGRRYLYVGAEYKNGVLRISVKDNGNGIEPEKLRELREGLGAAEFSGHIGMNNVYRRLRLYFDGSADMEILSEPGKGTEVIITVDYGGDKEDSGNV